MSISLERLRALRRQAGTAGAQESATEPATVVAATSVAKGVPGQAPSPPTGLGMPKPVPQEQQARAGGRAHDSAIARIERPALPAQAPGQDIASLRRLLDLRERRPGTTATAIRSSAPVDRALPGREIAPGLRLIETFLPQPIPPAPLSLAFARRPDAAVAPRELLFFDTETTGLAGGTGTRAFMIGAADWHLDAGGREGLRVRQLLIATMAAEPAMLDAFAGWLGPGTVLSSYNGRCYDAPLLKTRYRLARRGDPLAALEHVDLLHPTRRRYRGVWENCRLATIERQLLRIVREDDLPGSEAPAAWLAFLRGGSARNLRRVAAHNHQDVVTLALLFRRLVEAEIADTLREATAG